MMLFPPLLTVWTLLRLGLGCQLPTEWRPLSEGCRSELAEIIVYAKVLALYREPYAYVPLSARYTAGGHPYAYERAEAESAQALLYTAEVEMLCDQAWGSMLEVPVGSRLNITGLGYLSCQSHTVMENYSYIFFLRMDENYSFLPHAVNYQDAIFPDTQEIRHMFSSLFQFSNCSTLHSFSPDWESQEDHRLLCSSMQQVLFEEEERASRLQERVTELEKKNQKLKERVGKLKRSLSKERKASRRYEHELQELQQHMSTKKKNSDHHLNSISPPHRLSRQRHTHTL